MKRIQENSEGNKGFTLIELMIVIAIIGILASIVIPQFIEYKRKAYDASVKSDLSALATEMETYYISNSTYPTTVSTLTNFGWSSGVSGGLTNVTISDFTATASHQSSSNTFTYSIGNGGLWK
ncbi:MAG: prepilin-type N-terminal cleavage/methylation domain-containing protein [Nitrospinae bacterium]|nr:prepilin-type N-terminal cleavage/methylation domain-containing protein [Nitrospinota bacterium]